MEADFQVLVCLADASLHLQRGAGACPLQDTPTLVKHPIMYLSKPNSFTIEASMVVWVLHFTWEDDNQH